MKMKSSLNKYADFQRKVLWIIGLSETLEMRQKILILNIHNVKKILKLYATNNKALELIWTSFESLNLVEPVIIQNYGRVRSTHCLL